MILRHIELVVVATTFLSMISFSLAQVGALPDPIVTVKLEAFTSKGCFSSSEPLKDEGSYTFQTPGWCQKVCGSKKKPVMALVDGSNCWCGDLLPPKDTKIDDKKCNTLCNGYDKITCGGPAKYHVYLTGINKNQVENFDPKSSVTEGGNKATVVTLGGSTVVKTIGASATGDGSGSKPSTASKVGIGAGVVAGLLVMGAIVGGTVFYLKRRKRRAAEEAYRNANSVNTFIENGKRTTNSSSSMGDSRLDPEVMMHRRASDGSIADNQDYSRRILKVTNPDDL